MHAPRAGVPAIIAAALLASGCIYDSDARCGTNEVLVNGLCRCVDGGTISGNQCVVVDAGAPVAVGQQGAACDPSANDCTNPAYPHCQRAPRGDAYCTSTGCTSDADCTGGYVCVAGASPSYCRRPFTGQAVMCSENAECAPFDAQYCSVLAGFCLVRDCMPGPGGCDPGSTCFNASLVVPNAPWVCAANEVLEGVGDL